jgi:hypothetical protein
VPATDGLPSGVMALSWRLENVGSM